MKYANLHTLLPHQLEKFMNSDDDGDDVDDDVSGDTNEGQFASK